MPPRLVLAAALVGLVTGIQAAPGPLPPLSPLPAAAAAPLNPLLSAMEEPARLADAYAAARNTAAAQQWADATAKGKQVDGAPVALPPSAAATKPLVVASAQAATGAPNPTAGTKERSGEPPSDPVEAVVEAGADAVSGRPPRLVDLLMKGPGGGEGPGGRRLLAGAAAETAPTAAADDDDASGAAPSPKPRLSKYKLFKTADPHRGAAAGLASILPPHVALPALPGRR